VTPPALKVVRSHFPEGEKILETLYRRNESFRSLCKEFSDCVRAVEYWCHSMLDKEHASERCEEYKALCADLKKEIAQWLAGQNKGS
jgi:hypothetical protein